MYIIDPPDLIGGVPDEGTVYLMSGLAMIILSGILLVSRKRKNHMNG